MQPKLARQPGFTLTEILTTMAIAGITASLAAPGMQSLMRDSQQSKAANQMITSMHMARSAALTRNAAVTLCTSSAGQICEDEAWAEGWIVFVDDNRDGQRQPEETLLETSGYQDGVTISSADFPRALSFRGNGQVAGLPENRSTGRLAFCDVGGTEPGRVLLINAVGKPRSLTPEDSASGPRCNAPS